MSLALWEAQKFEESTKGRFTLVSWSGNGTTVYAGNMEGYEVRLTCRSDNKWSLVVTGVDIQVSNMSSAEAAINHAVTELAEGISIRTRAIKALTGVEV